MPQKGVGYEPIGRAKEFREWCLGFRSLRFRVQGSELSIRGLGALELGLQFFKAPSYSSTTILCPRTVLYGILRNYKGL